MQSPDEIEAWYQTPDPWAYKTTPDDAFRKEIILELLSTYGPFERALDIGCGEGFITSELPADHIEGIEISTTAASRLPANVLHVQQPVGKYDLIICTGMLYAHYDYQQFLDWMMKHTNGVILTCNIKEWERNTLPESKQVYSLEFNYRNYVQALRIYEC
jgi:2-polyprenyl-3-methyl-5-hydroxy-6-metoxy-1,4-benzoquinol methylase